jgi:hypothetical protein
MEEAAQIVVKNKIRTLHMSTDAKQLLGIFPVIDIPKFLSSKKIEDFGLLCHY